VVLIAAAFEVSRLGVLASRDLLLVLLAAVAGVLFLEDCSIREFLSGGTYERELAPFFPGGARRGYAPNYVVEAGSALLLAVAAFGFLRALRRLRVDERVAHVLFWIALGALLFVLR